jgi:hypothetical protein
VTPAQLEANDRAWNSGLRHDYKVMLDEFKGPQSGLPAYERGILAHLEEKAVAADARHELPAYSRAWEWLRVQKVRLASAQL